MKTIIIYTTKNKIIYVTDYLVDIPSKKIILVDILKKILYGGNSNWNGNSLITLDNII